MYVNSSGAENGSYSLTFLGKKVGRHQSVAPAGKQRECQTTTNALTLATDCIYLQRGSDILVFISDIRLHLVEEDALSDKCVTGRHDKLGLNISAEWPPPL